MRNDDRNQGSLPRVVLITRRTEYEVLLQHHATPQQAAFFLQTRGQSLESAQAGHDEFLAARQAVQNAVPVDWRRAAVSRDDLDRFLFEPRDIVVALGQDGLVANVAKYLQGQVVIGLNPDPQRYEGILVPHPPDAAADLIRTAGGGREACEERSMVTARLSDGREILALNEVFVGHRSHQSARYELEFGGLSERHSSSGLIVATGTGATGWAKSIARERRCELPMPEPTDRSLIFFVREAWPSVDSATEITQGQVDHEARLSITSRMDDGVIFGDGIEADYLPFGWGRRVELTVAPRTLRLMRE